MLIAQFPLFYRRPEENSDKVYVPCIRLTDRNFLQLFVSYGPRSVYDRRGLSELRIKQYTSYASEMGVGIAFDKLVNKKISEGYTPALDGRTPAAQARMRKAYQLIASFKILFEVRGSMDYHQIQETMQRTPAIQPHPQHPIRRGEVPKPVEAPPVKRLLDFS